MFGVKIHRIFTVPVYSWSRDCPFHVVHFPVSSNNKSHAEIMLLHTLTRSKLCTSESHCVVQSLNLRTKFPLKRIDEVP